MTTPAPSLREQILDHIATVTLPGTVQVGTRIYNTVARLAGHAIAS
jgi:hypothetical protein